MFSNYFAVGFVVFDFLRKELQFFQFRGKLGNFRFKCRKILKYFHDIAFFWFELLLQKNR